MRIENFGKEIEVRKYSGEYPDIPEFQKPWELRELRRVGQGGGEVTQGEPLISEGFSFCKAGILYDTRYETSALFHFEPDPRFFNKQKERLREVSRGGSTQAIFINGGCSSSMPYVDELIRPLPIEVVQTLFVPTERVHWGVVYKPQEDRIFVDNRKRKELAIFSGFKDII
jgi:hypothetical protein